MTSYVYPNGLTQGFEYDANGRQVVQRDPLGRQTRFRRDSLGRITKTTAPNNSTRDVAYDAIGRITSQTDEEGRVVNWEYGNHLKTRQDPDGKATTVYLDFRGNPIRAVDANGLVSSAEYDPAGRLTTLKDPRGAETHRVYDQTGKLTEVLDPLSQRTRFHYDEAGRLREIVNAAGEVTAYRYSGEEVAEVTDGNGHVSTMYYDPTRRVAVRTLPSGTSEEFRYDVTGRLGQHISFGGQSTSFEYENGSLVARRDHDGGVHTFEYQPDGARIRADQERYSYDAAGLLIADYKPSGETLEYSYSLSGRLVEMRGPGGTYRYTYGGGGQLLSVQDSRGGLTTYSYDDGRRLTGAVYPNQVVLDIEYDPGDSIVRLEWHRPDNGLMAAFAYERDQAGRITDVVEAPSGRRVQYEYDVASRLSSETTWEADGAVRYRTYAYDGVGNRLQADDSVHGVTNYTSDVDDRLLATSGAQGVVNYTYDSNGAHVSKGSTSYDYDSEQRLVRIRTGTTSTEFEYDADGMRVRSRRDGSHREFLLDKRGRLSNVVRETDPNGAVDYVYGNTLISAATSTGPVLFAHADATGTTRILTDSDGSVDSITSYSAFGAALDNGDFGIPIRFVGQELDASTGLYYMRARYYDPEIGRFISRDPERGSRSSPRSQNAYVYSGGDPVNSFDPSGRDFSLPAVSMSEAILAIQQLISADLQMQSQRRTDEEQLRDIAGLSRRNLVVFALEMVADGYRVDANKWFPELATSFLQLEWVQIAANSQKAIFVPWSRSLEPLEARLLLGDANVAAAAGIFDYPWKEHPEHPDIDTVEGRSVGLGRGFLVWPDEYEYVGGKRVRPHERVALIFHELSHYSNIGASHGHNSADELVGIPVQSPSFTEDMQNGRWSKLLVMGKYFNAGFPKTGYENVSNPESGVVYVTQSNAWAYTYQARDYLYGKYHQFWDSGS